MTHSNTCVDHCGTDTLAPGAALAYRRWIWRNMLTSMPVWHEGVIWYFEFHDRVCFAVNEL